MQRILVIIVLVSGLPLFGCKTENSSAGPSTPACEVLDKSVVSSLQGEQVAEVVPSSSRSGDLSLTQCFYRLPAYSRSVNFEITSGPSKSIEEYWDKRFRSRRANEEEEEEREKKGSAQSEEEREKEAKSKEPQAVPGLGDEALWVANQMNGSLFVRRGNAVYRIGIGGPEEGSSRLEKASALAKAFLEKKQ